MKVLLLGAIAYLLIVLVLARKKLPELHPRRFFLETWREADRLAFESRQARLASGDNRYDSRPMWAFLMLAVVLTVQEYFGDRDTFNKLKDRGWVIDYGGGPHGQATRHLTVFGPLKWLQSRDYDELFGLFYWVFTRAGFYLLAPALLLLAWRESPRDYGTRLRGFASHAWIYALFFGIVLIAVVLVGQTSEFVNYYPFYHSANRSWRDFFYWESVYALQFFALEFYFRGFLLFSSVRSMGSGVIVAMVVPYCMIHFGKPYPETFGAILAGTVLGTLALKTRSIWSGFLIHVTVALSMDITALLNSRGLPGGLKLPDSWGF